MEGDKATKSVTTYTFSGLLVKFNIVSMIHDMPLIKYGVKNGFIVKNHSIFKV